MNSILMNSVVQIARRDAEITPTLQVPGRAGGFGRRGGSGLGLFCLVVFVVFVVLSCQGLVAAQGADSPNIVLIMADDMGYECVTANGGESYETPRLDRMAAGGMRFEHCYSQPICTPSRVQIMTGRYNSRNYIQFGLLDKQAHTFAQLLKDVGYATCVIGKWQLSEKNERAFGDPEHFGFDEYCSWQLNRRPNRYPNPGLEINGKAVDYNNGEYGPDVVSDYGCQFMEKCQDGPFLLYYPMILPHWPFEPTPDSPEWDPTARRGDRSERSGRREEQFFDDMVTYTDKMVGKIIDKIDELDLAENTLVLFTGDNGTYSGITSRWKGRDWQGGKGSLRDKGTRVPLIARWRGRIEPGSVNEALVDFSDVLPTLADVAGVEVPDDYASDGRSVLPQLLGVETPAREWIYCWYFRNGKPLKPDGFKAGESARTHRYKLYIDGRFFDLARDPHEQTPLSNHELGEEASAVKARLRRVIERHTRPGFYDALNNS